METRISNIVSFYAERLLIVLMIMLIPSVCVCYSMLWNVLMIRWIWQVYFKFSLYLGLHTVDVCEVA